MVAARSVFSSSSSSFSGLLVTGRRATARWGSKLQKRGVFTGKSLLVYKSRSFRFFPKRKVKGTLNASQCTYPSEGLLSSLKRKSCESVLEVRGGSSPRLSPLLPERLFFSGYEGRGKGVDKRGEECDWLPVSTTQRLVSSPVRAYSPPDHEPRIVPEKNCDKKCQKIHYPVV